MRKIDVMRAWKDEDYRESLSDSERASLPKNPAGLVELSASDLALVSGGDISANGGPGCSNLVCTTWGTCGDTGAPGRPGPCY